ncbi:MAG: hypothetical protein R6V03_07385, partial [Kiritimatiellia bacterium]
VTARGHQTEEGPGAASGRSSAGHGGLGGKDNSTAAAGDVYGSITNPVTIGSGGGGSKGGGAVFLDITGDVTIDGAVTADGGATTANGPGSGGSVQLRVGGALSGIGTVSANGGLGGPGSGAMSSGGGGRVAVILETDGQDFSGFSGSIETYSPLSIDGDEMVAGAGTVYLQTGAQYVGGITGKLVVDNNGEESIRYRTSLKNTLMPDGVDIADFSEVVVTNEGFLAVDADNPLTWSNVNLTAGGSDVATIVILDDAQVIYPATLDVDGFTLTFWDSAIKTLSNLTVRSDGSLVQENGMKLDLTLTGDLTVYGTITMSSRGYSPGSGPGEPSRGTADWVGGGYGGQGADVNGTAASRPTYGSFLAPADAGSPGDGVGGEVSGGGLIVLSVTGATTVASGGVITANGAADRANGSGGGIMLTTASISGGGAIRANGGDESRADGGGGRVAVILTGADEDFASFDGSGGTIEARAPSGSGDRAAAAGTVYRQTGNEGSGEGTVYVDNNGIDADNPYTTLPPSQGLLDDLSKTTFVVDNAAELQLTADVTIGGLVVNSSTALDLAGWKLTSRSVTVDGETYKGGTYTAVDFQNDGHAEIIDSSDPDTGEIVIPASGTVFSLR